MRERPGPTQFTREQAAEVIREATELSLASRDAELLTREDLASMARELGIDEVSLEKAIAAREGREVKHRRAASELRKLSRHAGIYAVVLTGLAVLDWLDGGGWWIQGPAIGWGIGLGAHAWSALWRLGRRRSAWPREAGTVATQGARPRKTRTAFRSGLEITRSTAPSRSRSPAASPCASPS